MQRNNDAAAVRIFSPAIPLVTILAGVGVQRVWPIAIGTRVEQYLERKFAATYTDYKRKVRRWI